MKIELFKAIRKGNRPMIIDCINNSPISLYEIDEMGHTGLMVASGLGKADVVEVLLNKGADVNTSDSKVGVLTSLELKIYKVLIMATLLYTMLSGMEI